MDEGSLEASTIPGDDEDNRPVEPRTEPRPAPKADPELESALSSGFPKLTISRVPLNAPPVDQSPYRPACGEGRSCGEGHSCGKVHS